MAARGVDERLRTACHCVVTVRGRETPPAKRRVEQVLEDQLPARLVVEEVVERDEAVIIGPLAPGFRRSLGGEVGSCLSQRTGGRGKRAELRRLQHRVVDRVDEQPTLDALSKRLRGPDTEGGETSPAAASARRRSSAIAKHLHGGNSTDEGGSVRMLPEVPATPWAPTAQSPGVLVSGERRTTCPRSEVHACMVTPTLGCVATTPFASVSDLVTLCRCGSGRLTAVWPESAPRSERQINEQISEVRRVEAIAAAQCQRPRPLVLSYESRVADPRLHRPRVISPDVPDPQAHRLIGRRPQLGDDQRRRCV